MEAIPKLVEQQTLQCMYNILCGRKLTEGQTHEIHHEPANPALANKNQTLFLFHIGFSG